MDHRVERAWMAEKEKKTVRSLTSILSLTECQLFKPLVCRNSRLIKGVYDDFFALIQLVVVVEHDVDTIQSQHSKRYHMPKHFVLN